MLHPQCLVTYNPAISSVWHNPDLESGASYKIPTKSKLALLPVICGHNRALV